MGEADFGPVKSNDSFTSSFSNSQEFHKLFDGGLVDLDKINPMFEATNALGGDSEPIEPKTFEYYDESTCHATNSLVNKHEQNADNSFPTSQYGLVDYSDHTDSFPGMPQGDLMLSPAAARSVTPGTSNQPDPGNENMSAYMYGSVIPLNHTSLNDPGLYDFHVSFRPETKLPSKNAPYTFSPDLGKLFANINKRIPINLYCQTAPPPNSRVRITAMFAKPENANDIVRQCPNHNKEIGEKICNTHFIVADMAKEYQAYYSYDRNNRESVSILFNGLACTAVLKLMCLSSCKVINRREMVLVFDLENENGMQLGRQTVNFVVSTCPGRDRPKAENQPSEPQRKRRRVQTSALSNVTNVSVINESPAPGCYTLSVKHPDDYLILKRLRDALELKRAQEQ